MSVTHGTMPPMGAILVHVTGDNTTLVTGLISGGVGVVGVVIGSFLASGREYLSRKRNTRARQRHAARVLVDELRWDRAALDEIVEKGDASTWDIDTDDVLTLWRAHRDALSDIPLADWFAVEIAIRDLATGDLTAYQELDLTDELRGRIKHRATRTRDRLDRARDGLGKYMD
jgi:hypothetical protein